VQSRNFPVPASFHADLVWAHANNGDVDGVRQALLSDRVVDTDISMQNALLAAHATRGDIEGARQAMARLQRCGSGNLATVHR
jgi:hypothetical protein